MRRFSCNICVGLRFWDVGVAGIGARESAAEGGSLAECEDALDLRALGPVPRFSSQLKKMLSPAKGKRGLAAHEGNMNANERKTQKKLYK